MPSMRPEAVFGREGTGGHWRMLAAEGGPNYELSR